MKNVIEFTHAMLQDHLTADSVVIDATCGNGHDTLFLAGRARHVHAFDIQDSAIQATKTRLASNGLTNVTYHPMSHTAIGDVVDEPVRAVIFNLGYLPGSDKSVTTTYQTTLAALKSAMGRLEKTGVIAMVLYPGHPQGMEEVEHIELFLQSLPAHYLISKHTMVNRHNAPFLIFIQQRSV